MDNNNVIEIDGDANDLDREILQWQQLPFDLRKISDSNCIAKYGCNNIQLYNNMKARLLSTGDIDNSTIRLENARIYEKENTYHVVDLSEVSIKSDLATVNSSDKHRLIPIYLIASFDGPYKGMIIKSLKKYKFYNVGLSFDPSFKSIYYYSLIQKQDVNEMSVISLSNYYKISQYPIAVSVIFLEESVAKKLKSGVEKYLINQRNSRVSSFGYMGDDIMDDNPSIFSYSYTKIVTDFINSLFLISGIDINQDDYKYLDHKSDNKKNNINSNVFMIYNGQLRNFGREEALVKVRKIESTIGLDANFFNDVYNKKYITYTKLESAIEMNIKTGSSDNIVTGDDENVISDKINQSKKIMNKDNTIFIINPFGPGSEYSTTTLDDIYNGYLSTSDMSQKLSNNYSVQLWGKSVPEMYQIMKNQLESMYGDANIIPSSSDETLDDYKKQVSSEVISQDPVRILTRKLEMCNLSNANLYESAVLEDFNKSVEYIPHNYNEDIPQITPFLNYNEYMKIYPECNLTPESYILQFSDNELNSYDKLRSLYNENNSEELLKYGWNPIVKPTAENMKYARDKQVDWMNENCRVNIIDASKIDFTSFVESTNIEVKNRNLSPIFIILSFTGTPAGLAIKLYGMGKYKYSHACLALDSTLQKMYTFNMKAADGSTGFVVENIDDYFGRIGPAKLKVMCLFVTKKVKSKIDKTLKFYEDNKAKTKYSIEGLGKLIAKITTESKYSLNMFCSQFVDSILKIADIDISGKDSNLVAPEDLGKNNNSVNIYTVFEGLKRDYKASKINEIIENLMKSKKYKSLRYQNNDNSNISISNTKKNKYEIFNKKSLKEMTEELESYIDDNNNLYKLDEVNVSGIISQLEYYVNPTAEISCLDEIKIPFGFNNKGDLYISKTINLQQEYNESHKLLSMYDQSNEEGIKHELARLFYLNSIIESKIKKKKKDDPEYKELMDLRARILNDFTTYFKVIKNSDKDFDFMNYLKHSEYYNKTITVDNSTLKFSGIYIKSILKTLLK